jgi:rsbT co-antagonist protein RsbR
MRVVAMSRSIERYVLGGVIAFIVVILAAVILVVASMRDIEREGNHLASSIVPWVEASREYDVGMTSMLGSLQTYLIALDADELEEANASLQEIDTSIQQLTHLEDAGVLTEHGDIPELALFQQHRAAIRDAATSALTHFRGLGPDAIGDPELFEQIETLEDDLGDLHHEQLLLREQNTSIASTAIAAAFRQTLLVIGVFSTLVTILVAGIYVAMRRIIVRPILRLSQATEAIGAGHYMIDMDTTGVAEMGRLQQQFQRMAALLGEREAALEQQVTLIQQSHASAQQAEQRLTEQLETIGQQRDMIREMSVPLLPIGERTLVMPLVGILDTERLDTMQSHALERISHQRTDMLLMDVTGVPIIDSQVAQGLVNVVQAARLLGTRVALVGIRPEVAQTIVGLGINLSEIRTFASLQEGIRSSFAQSRRVTDLN